MATSPDDMRRMLAQWQAGTASDGSIAASASAAVAASGGQGSAGHARRPRVNSSILPDLDPEEDDPNTVGSLAWLQQRGRSKDASVGGLGDVREVAVLGQGTFARVSLVQHSGTGRLFALKAMDKATIVRLKQQRNIVFERALLGAVSHPFLLQVVSTFQDAQRLYLLLDWVPGGELFGLLERRHTLPPADTKFYTACVAHALSYLHAMHILYRDLKPENILLDDKGYVRVVDFGFAKHVPERTYTLCGTPAYLAPECLTAKGYDASCDWWALGILVFECLTGSTPFDDAQGSMRDIMAKVLREPVQFPDALLDADLQAVSFCRGLLQKKPVHRLGCQRGGSQEVLTHPWLDSVDFKALLNKELPAPWVPELDSPQDTRWYAGASEAAPVDAEIMPPAPSAAGGEATAAPGEEEWCAGF